MKHTTHTSCPLWQRLLSVASAVLLMTTALAEGVPVAAVADTHAADTTVPTVVPADTVAELSPAALLIHVLGQPLTEAERQWLETEAADSLPADLTFTYDGTVSHENVTLSVPSEGQVTVTAHPFTGDTLGTAWTPVSVTVGDASYPLTVTKDGNYTALVSCDSTLATVTVTYESTLPVSADAVSALLNAAHTRGEEVNAAYTAYEQALAEHTAASEAYEAYREALQQYKSDLALYNAYLTAQKAYEERLVVYQAYLEDLAAYEAELAVYNAYLAEKEAYDKAYATYMDFIQNPAEYEKKYLAYCDHLVVMSKVEAQLALIDSCFVSDSGGHMLNATLNGPTVSSVVARQDELVSVGVDAKDISNADKATEALITLLGAYPKDGEDGERYAYYIAHYTEIRDNVTLLYTSLSRLYGNDAVPDILQMQGKLERYWQFVAQLYALSCALEDEIAFDVNWRISTGKLTELLEPCFILNDTNTATPLAVYPTPMEAVTSPGDMKKPTPPTAVEKPVAPLRVTEPTPPETVTKPVLPPVADDPGQRPDRPLFSACEQSLAEAVAQGTLKKRDEVITPVDYPLTVGVGKCISLDGTPTLSCYLDDRMTLIAAMTADGDGKIILPEDIPEKPADQGTTYSFEGWSDGTDSVYQAGETLTVTEDAILYATFSAKREIYTVTWDMEGERTEEKYAFGELPAYDGTPHKEADETHVYTFAGWSPAITPVSGDVTYTAIFTPHERVYEIQWVIGDTTETDEYRPGELPAYHELPTRPMDGRYRYVFKGWSPEIVAVSGDAVYTATFEAVDLLPDAGDTATVTEQEGMIIAAWPTTETWQLGVDALIVYAQARDSGLLLSSNGVTLSFSSEDVRLMAEASVARLSLVGIEGGTLCLELYNAYDVPLSRPLEARMTLTLPSGQLGQITDDSGASVSTRADSGITVTLAAGKRYTLTAGYEINLRELLDGVETDVGGVCATDTALAMGGEQVTVKVTPAPGYTLERLSVSDGTGTEISYTVAENGQYRFTMPEGTVYVAADFVPMLYTVRFTSGDTVISERTYRYGETPTVPDDPTRDSDDTYSYTFTGWSPNVTIVMRDAVYEAQFMAVPLGGRSSVTDSGMGLVQLFLLGFGSFAVVCAGILVPYMIVSKRKYAKTDGTDAQAQEV